MAYSKPHRLLAAACFAVLCITLSLGFWPFHTPRNQVTWKENGIEFGKYGTVWSAGPLSLPAPPESTGYSIEILMRPSRWATSATFLSFYTPGQGIPLALSQSLTSLRLDENLRGSIDAVKEHTTVAEVFGQALRRNKFVFLTVTSGSGGTTVYVDGAVAGRAPGFRIPAASFQGQVVLGDAPRQPNSFTGEIRDLALFNAELSAAQAARDFETWTREGRPDAEGEARPAALFLFTERSGDRIHNQASPGMDLYIPRKYAVLDKIVLEPFWEEFTLTRSYWSSAGKNIIGFVPFGFIFYALIGQLLPRRRAVWATVFLGTLVSLTIEVGQVYLPMRDSGTTDLFTNTFGTYLGVLCFRHLYPLAERQLPWVGRFFGNAASGPAGRVTRH
ncbi:MAG: VanZ family protein [Bryobacterales bacterium]|nr:VanZ family protein [Bryobacterales bacterium]